MLVLSRKRNEVITIGDEITVVVVEIRGDKVRLGIQAPKNIEVHRQEVWLAILAGKEPKPPVENKSACSSEDQSLESGPAKPFV